MKRILFCVMAMAVMLSSCEKISSDDTTSQEQNNSTESRKFTFTIKGDFNNPTFISGDEMTVKNEVGNGTQLAKTRAVNDYMVADGVEMTDLWVVDVVKTSADAEGTGAIKQMIHQTPSDSDWGAPTMNLTIGTHHVMFLASRGTGAQYNDGTVTWSRPLDTFYKDYEVTVVKTSNGNRSVTLDRVSTKMILKIEDAIPAGTTAIKFLPSKKYSGWNMLSGEPTVQNNSEVTVNVPSTYAGRTGVEIGLWSLSGKDEWMTDIDITSMVGETENAHIVIPNVPLKANRASVYSGCLYSNNSESSISLNTTWSTNYEGVY